MFTAANIRQRHDNLAVKAARAQQRRVEHVRTVGRSHHDHAFIALETVHFDEQLVQCLLALVVPAPEAGTAMASDGVDLIDEDDTGRMLLRGLEHVANARGAYADKHFDEIRARDREKRHLGFTRNGFREQGLAGTGRAHHQDPARDASAELLELARVAQEVDQFGDLGLGFVGARNIIECHVHLVLAEHARLALAERHRTASARTALHLAHEKHPDADQQQEREP